MTPLNNPRIKKLVVDSYCVTYILFSTMQGMFDYVWTLRSKVARCFTSYAVS